MTRNRLHWLTDRPIAHRGFHDRSRGRPENTLAAFSAAIARRYAIECDLHISADGVPMVFHDDTLERLTGETGDLRERTAAELARLRIHRTAEHVPTLDEMLQLVAGQVTLLLELKCVPGRDAGLAFAVAERLRRYGGPAAVMSFDPGLIAETRVCDPNLPRGLTAEGNWREAGKLFRAAMELGADFVSYSIDDLPTPMPLVSRYVLGLPLICWTVRTEAQRRKAAKWTDQITFEGFEA